MNQMYAWQSCSFFLLAHSNKTVDWVARLPAERRRRLRLVYNTGCHDLPQGPRWLSLGAKTYIGHPGKSASSVFYVFFLRRWTRGYTAQEALEASNDLMRSAFKRAAAFSFGRLDAAWLNQKSVAFCFGEKKLRLEDCTE